MIQVKLFKHAILGGLVAVILWACTDTASVKGGQDNAYITEAILPVIDTLPFGSLSLTTEQYQEWLRSKYGVTYDSKDNGYFAVSLLYKPLPFESALSMQDTSAAEFEKAMSIKKGYHYFLLECLERKTSVNSKTNKDSLANVLQENFYLVEIGGDTVRNVVAEFFPAHLLNQPHQLLLLVPDEKACKGLKAGLRASSHVPGLTISITQKQIQTLPEIKL